MSIIQISKIQQRSGNLVDLPQLDEAQFGWASDAKRLFIGKTTPNENVEVLTAYSNISFSQIEGAGGSNVNIDDNTLQNGQLLIYVETTNTWENYTGNSSQIGNSKIQLGNVANLKMEGGSTGFVLQTDGLGNLSWTPKTTIVANIVALSNATPVMMTVANTIPYTNGSIVTISGVNGVSNANINSYNFYVKLASNFPSSGNVQLYANSDFTGPLNGTGLTYTNSPNALAITTVGGTSTLVAAGSNTSIQFNNSGILQGSPYFNILNGNGLLTHTGPYFAVGNVYANSGAVVANQLTGSLMTNAQPNITSTGTLVNLSVTANANIGNIGTAGLITATGNVRGGNLVTGGALSATGNANVGNLGTTTAIITTGNITTINSGLFQNGNSNVTLTSNANVTIYVAGNATARAVFTSTGANISGTANITGNANVGNMGTAQVLATANITTPQLISNIATGTAPLVVTSTTQVANLSVATAGTVTTAAQPNITSVGTLTSLSVSGNISTGDNSFVISGRLKLTSNTAGGYVNQTDNSPLYLGANNFYPLTINFGISAAASNISISSNLSVTGNISAGNVSATTFTGALSGAATSATTAGTVTTAAQGNITSVGTLTSLSVSGNANVGNISATNHTGTTSNLTGQYITTLAIGTAPFVVTSTTQVANLSVATAGSATTAGTVTTAAQSNITSVGTLTSLSVTGNVTTTANIGGTGATHIGNTFTTGANTTVGTITGNFSLSAGSRLNSTYADLAEYYEADAHYEPGTILAFGGDKEVTIAQDSTTRVAGVVSTNPAYAMNTNCEGIAVAIALQGRVPTKVRGTIHKGDMMVSAGNGFARTWNNPAMGTVIGKALENFEGIEGVIEVAIGRL